MIIENWGLIDYQTAWQRQEQLFQETISRKMAGLPTGNRLIFCEHPHVYTLGKHGNPQNMLLSAANLQKTGATFVQTDRGGDITYHGPGQIVGYPIFDLATFGIGLKQYVSNVEEAIIQTLLAYGIQTGRLHGATGVWLDTGKPSCRKIAAIGVRSSHFITMHGFALNVNTDLRYFRAINPCGFIDKGVTSMQFEKGIYIDMEEVRAKLAHAFIEIFQTN